LCTSFFFRCRENETTNQKPKIIRNSKIPLSAIDSGRDDDTLYQDKDFIVLGNRSEPASEAIRYIGIKFKPHISFTDFPAEVEIAKKARLKYDSNPIAREYKTRITETYNKEPVNFGGHYVFIEWGCGSPCHMSALADINTGIVYDGVSSGYGYDFKKDSRMLIANPTGLDSIYLNCVSCEPLIYLWNEKNKKFIPK